LNATGTGTAAISVQNLDTQDFYDALLSPVDFTNLYAFQRQGYPRELLFRLFTDYVSVKPPVNVDPQGQRAFVIHNDPAHEKECYFLTERDIAAIYPPELRSGVSHEICFGELVEFALLSGLSSEIRNVTAPTGSDKQSNAGTAKSASAASTTSNTAASTPKSTTEARLCFDGALANDAINEFRSNPPPKWGGRDVGKFLRAVRLAEYHPTCGGTQGLDIWPSKGSTSKKGAAPTTNQSAGTNTIYVSVKAFTGQPIWDIHRKEHNTVEIGTRSTFAIYNFLGLLMNNQDSKINTFITPAEFVEDRHVLTVNKGQPAGCFVATVLDLGVYCVPVDGAQNTKRSFSILSQLLALKTTTGDLQLQPIFRLLSE
jgi:hypothetical protein